MSESSFTINQFQEALRRTSTPEEQIKFDLEYQKNAMLRQAANDALLYEQQGGNLIKDTMKGDWIRPLLPLFVFITMAWWVLLVQNFNSGPGASLVVLQPEYTIPSAPPQNNHNAGSITLGVLPTDDLPETPHRQGDFTPNRLGKNTIKNRNVIEKSPKDNIVNTQKTNSDAIVSHTDNFINSIPIERSVYGILYDRTGNSAFECPDLCPEKTIRTCSLNKNDSEMTPDRSCNSVLFIPDNIINANTIINPSPIDSFIEKPVIDNKAPDPNVIRLLLSSFR